MWALLNEAFFVLKLQKYFKYKLLCINMDCNTIHYFRKNNRARIGSTPKTEKIYYFMH